MDQPILVVDDDEVALTYYRTVLEHSGMGNVVLCQDSRNVNAWLREDGAALMLLDLNMPHLGGEEVIKKVRPEYPDLPIVIITSEKSVESAVACMKLGAFDYLVKPVEGSRLAAVVRHALEMRALKFEVDQLSLKVLSRELKNPDVFRNIITQNSAMKDVFAYLEAVAGGRKPLLITGESGTGKELLARAFHALSRPLAPFVPVNVAGLDDTMFSDTLFGHARGAFTGAAGERKGLIEQASEGTLFLDEIGDLGPSSQVKLLRLLQEEEFYPLGSDKVRLSRARILTATNADLKEQMESGNFRRDLYFRLISHHVRVPPLRERLDDLPLLVNHFLEEEGGLKAPSLPRELYDLLSSYHYPGNVRELAAMLEDAVSRHTGGVLSLASIRDYLVEQRGESKGDSPAERSLSVTYAGSFPTLKEVEEYVIQEALEKSNGNQTVAAQLLGINQSTLSRRLKVD